MKKIKQPKRLLVTGLVALIASTATALAQGLVPIQPVAVPHGVPNAVPNQVPATKPNPTTDQAPTAKPNPAAESTSDAMQKADEYFNQDNYEGAIPEYTKVINADPSNVNAYFQRARCERRLHLVDAAMQDLDVVIKLDPKHSAAYYARGVENLDSLGKVDAAYENFLKCVELDPNDADALNNIGRVYLERRNEEQALVYFNKAKDLNPKMGWAYNNIAMVYLHRGNYDTALGYENQAVELDPENGHHYYKRGLIYQGLGKYDLAEKDFTEARSLGFNF